MMRIGKYLLPTALWILILCLGAFASYAQVKAVASANKRSISENDVVTIQFNVENTQEIQQFIPPAFKGCKVVEGPMHVAGSSVINGVQRSYISVVYIIQPFSPGRYSFSGASAKVNGSRMTFNTVNVDVLEGVGGANRYPLPKSRFEEAAPDERYSDYVIRSGENLKDKIRRNLFIKVDVSKTSCYEGEPVVASYKLYTRLRSESKVSRRPSFNGFSVYDMIDPLSTPSEIEKLNGKDFNVYLIRKAQLFPLQSGLLELDAAEVENSITFLKAEYAMKDRGEHLSDLLHSFEADDVSNEGVELEKVNIKSNPVTVKVKALPEASKPASFDGAVGKFSIEATVDKKELGLNDAAILKVLIKGEGNFGIINAPVIHWPANVEVYEPSAKEDFLKSMVPLRGYKTFQFTFMPKRSGDITIPGIEFSYFDPRADQYKTMTTAPIPIHTRTAQAKPEEFSGMQTNPGFEGNNRTIIFSIAALLLIGFGFLLFRYIAASTVKQTLPTMKHAKEEVKTVEPPIDVEQHIAPLYNPDPLFNSRLMLIQQNNNGFYAELGKTIKDFAIEKLKLPVNVHAGKREIERALRMNGYDDILVSQFQLILQQCEVALYTPSVNETEMQSAYDLAEDFIQHVNERQI